MFYRNGGGIFSLDEKSHRSDKSLIRFTRKSEFPRISEAQRSTSDDSGHCSEAGNDTLILKTQTRFPYTRVHVLVKRVINENEYVLIAAFYKFILIKTPTESKNSRSKHQRRRSPLQNRFGRCICVGLMTRRR